MTLTQSRVVYDCVEVEQQTTRNFIKLTENRANFIKITQALGDSNLKVRCMTSDSILKLPLRRSFKMETNVRRRFPLKFSR